MDVTQLPFNRLIGLESAPVESGFLVSVHERPQYTTHLGTVHASSLLAVVEAASGVFLLRNRGHAEGFVPVVRRLECKLRKPASGRVSGRADVPAADIARWSVELASRGRVSITVPVEVIDGSGVVVVT